MPSHALIGYKCDPLGAWSAELGVHHFAGADSTGTSASSRPGEDGGWLISYYHL